MQAYAAGIFPMAESRDNPEIFWVEPQRRGIFPLRSFHISRSLARRLRKQPYQLSYDTDFVGVVDGCAAREETWINAEIRALYLELHTQGDAHSIEVWEDGALVGGVYGVVLGGAFFGESMFSIRVDASKIALAYLTDHLAQLGFELFDTQFLTPHLASLGAVEIGKLKYRDVLAATLRAPASFSVPDRIPTPHELIQRNAQTS